MYTLRLKLTPSCNIILQLLNMSGTYCLGNASRIQERELDKNYKGKDNRVNLSDFHIVVLGKGSI